MGRKLYGSQPDDGRSFASMLPNAGDPDFETDAQNNDEQFRYDTDYPNENRGRENAGDE